MLPRKAFTRVKEIPVGELTGGERWKGRSLWKEEKEEGHFSPPFPYVRKW